MHRTCRFLALAALLVALTPQSGNAQHRHAPGTEAKEAKSAAPYHPGLGDLMTAFVQPRHIKLGLAGQERNWAYVAYELNELREAFDDVKTLVPKHGNLDIPDAIGATVDQPMTALAEAIKAQDAAAFTTAYASLTRACNACHASTDHPEIVIRVPSEPAFPDQDFRPQKP